LIVLTTEYFQVGGRQEVSKRLPNSRLFVQKYLDLLVVIPSLSEHVTHGPYDYIVIALKNTPDVYSIPSLIQPIIAAGTQTIVLIQNGYDIEQPFLDAFPSCTVLSGVSMIGSSEKNGKVLHNDPDILYLAPYSSEKSKQQEQVAKELADMYTEGGAACHLVDDIVLWRWRKLVWNATFNTVCALTGLDSGAIQEANGIDLLIRPAMDEIVQLAAAAGYKLPENIQQQMIDFTPRELKFKPSMLNDVEAGNPMEIDVILSNPLKVGKKFGVETPVLEMIYRMLLMVQWKTKSNKPAS
jgi:2-dehydropantoate 2-reductase